MNRLRLALVFSVLYVLLLVGAYSAANQEKAKPEPFKWTVTPLPIPSKSSPT